HGEAGHEQEIRQVVGVIPFEGLEIDRHGEQGDTVERNTVIGQVSGDGGGARCAVTFAKQEEWRIPTFVAGEVEADEFSEGLYVTFYAEKFLGKFGGGGSRITGRHGVNHDDVAAIEQRVGIVFEAIRGGGHESIGLQYHPFGTERAHMETHGSGAGPAIECEGERTLVSILTVERVGNEKHLRLDLAVAALDGKPAGGGGIGESLSIQAELVMRDHGRD